MERQHSIPILLPSGAKYAVPLKPLTQQGTGMMSEADIQALVQEHPECLPIAEIDAMFSGPVPICTELNTIAGPIDNFMVTPSGLPVLVECKLWRNPEGRPEVVSQILDYAKELTCWTSADLQREVSRRPKRIGNPLLEMVRAVDARVDEAQFSDALTANLRRGRFLLLIVGDGIREGVEAIAEYLQAHAGLHFTLGLVELPVYAMPNGDRLVAPRVLARTMLITRNVVAVPDGYIIEEEAKDPEIDPELIARAEAHQRFWKEFLDSLKLDDPEQSKPTPTRKANIWFDLPARGAWLSVYHLRSGDVGLFLTSSANSVGAHAIRAVVEDFGDLREELGGTVRLYQASGRPSVIDTLPPGQMGQTETRKWLADRVNTFVNILRPRIRSAAADHRARGE